jgi:hypothetical protein
VTPQDTIFDFSTPAIVDSADPSSTEVGVKFSSELGGTITGIRFYKAAANTGTHIGSLWSSSGTLLASATFTGETESGWQQVNFSSPVTINPNTTYVAAYLAPKGHYSDTSLAFANVGVENPPLRAIASPISANGVFAHGGSSVFPTSTSNSTNYWVDVAFVPTPLPGKATNASATEGPRSATVTWGAPSGGGPVTTYTITPYIGSEPQPATTVTGSPPATEATITGLTAGTTYTFTVQASNVNGAGPPSEPSNPVTPSGATPPSIPTGVTASAATNQALVSWTESSSGGSPITAYIVTPYIGATAQTPVEVTPNVSSVVMSGLTNGTAYTFTVTATNAIGSSPPSPNSGAVTPQDTVFDFATPVTIDSGDTSATVVGVKFSSEAYGAVTGIRFYKAAANTGTHIGSLWSSSGTLLASATFTGETASGWQQVNFSSPVTINPNTTYLAGYLAPKGHYSATSSAFASLGANKPPLSTLANPVSADGVFAHSTTITFPTNTFNATNYWVDVDFEPAPVPGQVTGVSATAAGNGSANVTWSAPSNGGPVTTYTITPYVGPEAQQATTVSGSPPSTNAKIGGLTNGTAYTFTVQASNPNGGGPVSEQSNVATPPGYTTPSAPTGVAASTATSQALVSWTAPSSNGGSPITGYTVTPLIGSSAQAPVEVSASKTSTIVNGLTNGTTYTFTVTANNAAGAGPASTASSTVTPANTIFDFATPAIIDSNDGSSVNLGVKFSSEVAGTITGIRFYKAATNVATHVGSLWSSTGTLLAQATFTGETATGWQQVNFSTPVTISPNTTYIASYLAPKGHYSDTSSGFASVGVTNPPLAAFANTISANGLYLYGSTSKFPTNTYRATNYWVDVDFLPSH